MTCLLLEDEPLAIRRTRGYLDRYGQGLQEVGWCQSVADAVAWLDDNPAPELIISDIELLDGNVFGLYEQRPQQAPIIFATAYDQFLLKAFETNGVGYLLKPYSYEQFAAAIDKVRALIELGQSNATPPGPSPALDPTALAALRHALTQQTVSYRERFTVKRTSGITLLLVEDTAMLLSEDKVTFAVDAQGKRHPLGQTLNALEANLDPRKWFRVNRGELVHMPYIERLEPYGRDRLAIHLRGIKGHAAITSRERTPELRKWIGS